MFVLVRYLLELGSDYIGFSSHPLLILLRLQQFLLCHGSLNDMFILVRYFSELGIDSITDKKAQS